ncbi:MAG TPA: hypothetical protein VFN78_15205 [Ktedonobacterales bacterium]|nr:hypothetical protein [Ktedonobacterales bacterium]
MRNLLVTVTLVLALLGVFGVASFYALSIIHPVATHVHQLAGPVCPGGGSGTCG